MNITDREVKAIYNQLYNLHRKDLVKLDTKEPKKERKNSSRSRAHRLNQILDEVQEKPIVKSNSIDRVSAIVNMVRMYERGWLSDQNLLAAIQELLDH